MHTQTGEMMFIVISSVFCWRGYRRRHILRRQTVRNRPHMPTNKRESLIFTVIMCFCMVLWMSIYNVARMYGHVGIDVIVDAWVGFPPAYIFAMLCDVFVAGPLAKGFAFKYLVTPGKSSPRAMTLAVSGCMVVPMVVIMSLYGAFEGPSMPVRSPLSPWPGSRTSPGTS